MSWRKTDVRRIIGSTGCKGGLLQPGCEKMTATNLRSVFMGMLFVSLVVQVTLQWVLGI